MASAVATAAQATRFWRHGAFDSGAQPPPALQKVSAQIRKVRRVHVLVSDLRDQPKHLKPRLGKGLTTGMTQAPQPAAPSRQLISHHHGGFMPFCDLLRSSTCTNFVSSRLLCILLPTALVTLTLGDQHLYFKHTSFWFCCGQPKQVPHAGLTDYSLPAII